jgi:methyl-accepting chemotaxis protein
LVEEAAAASESLQDQAGNLAQVVSIFKLNGSERASNGVGKGTSRLRNQERPKLKAVPSRAGVKPKKSAVGGGGSDEAWEEF